MIDYEILCRTIEDWKAGRRPTTLRNHISAASQPPPPRDMPPPEDRTQVFDTSDLIMEDDD